MPPGSIRRIVPDSHIEKHERRRKKHLIGRGETRSEPETFASDHVLDTQVGCQGSSSKSQIDNANDPPHSPTIEELENAVLWGDCQVLQTASKKSVNARLSDQDTLLHIAAIENQLGVAKCLYEKGAIVDARNEESYTPLHEAVREGHLVLVQWLVSIGADLTAVTLRGWSILHIAVMSRRTEMLEYLLSLPAIDSMRNFEDEDGASPFDLVCRRECVDAFWTFARHDLYQMTEEGVLYLSRRNAFPLAPARTPAWIMTSLADKSVYRPVTSHLEDYLRSIYIADAALPSPEYCLNCRSLREQEPHIAAQIDARLRIWKGAGKSFTTGFLTRCEQCRAHVSNVSAIRGDQSSVESFDTNLYDRGDGKCDDDLRCILSHDQGPANPRYSDGRARSIASYWLLHCLKTHTECRHAPEHAVLPKRVLEIDFTNNQRTVRIHEPGDGATGMYTTLSYRWGENPLRTTKESLPFYREAIPWQLLPEPIQNAMIVTSDLGFRYIWIDALCIVQDNDIDWHRQIKAMGAIYRNSVLTIGVDMDPTYSRSCTSLKPWMAETSESASGVDRVLQSRGWILQELLLSSRMLIFTEGDILWECSQTCASGAVPHGFHSTSASGTRAAETRIMRQFLCASRRSSCQVPRKVIYAKWMLFITEYTRRDLTLEADRLPAILGVADACGELVDDELVVGLWRSDFVRQLFWWVIPDDQLQPFARPLADEGNIFPFDRPKKASFRRPTTYVAPTWSWASVVGPVSYAALVQDLSTNLYVPVLPDEGWQYTTEIRIIPCEAEARATVLKFDILPRDSGIHIYSSVRTLVLRGMMFKANVSSLYGKQVLRAQAHCRRCCGDTAPNAKNISTVHSVHWFPDLGEQWIISQNIAEVECLYLAQDGRMWHCVCLRPSPEHSHGFERIGVCTWEVCRCYCHAMSLMIAAERQDMFKSWEFLDAEVRDVELF